VDLRRTLRRKRVARWPRQARVRDARQVPSDLGHDLDAAGAVQVEQRFFDRPR